MPENTTSELIRVVDAPGTGRKVKKAETFAGLDSFRNCLSKMTSFGDFVYDYYMKTLLEMDSVEE